MNRVRLGDFVLDMTSGELWPAGNGGDQDRIVLREQPFRVLRLLIDNQGRIVTRAEIRKRLWPNDTFVDFDHSINVAIAALRRSLGDSAESPRYIETLARRGYRLLVSTERLESDAAGQTAGAPRPPADLQSLIGKKVSHYRVIEVIGGGGMGMVYRAEDLKLGRPVALKFLPEELAGDPEALRMLQREAQTASALNHPNICTIYEIEEVAGQPFIAMELLDGETVLEQLASRQGPIPLAGLVDIGIQVCNGLQAAHDRGVIHRDIKPPNIFLTTQGTVKILDFGVAKLVQPDGADDAHASRVGGAATHPGGQGSSFRSLAAAGTPSYMSPEQVRKEPLDTRSDLFSLGIVLYEMAVGRRPFAGDTQRAIQDAIATTAPPPPSQVNPAVPRRLEAILAKALEKDRSRRYLSAADLREDLQALQRGSGRSPARKWLAGAALLTAAAGLAVYARLPHRVRLSEIDTVVVADLVNQTGDTVLDVGLNPALRVGLEQTPYLNVLTLDKVMGTRRLFGLPPTARTTVDVALRICRRTNSRMVLSGSVSDAGNQFGIELSALECQSGTRVAQVRQEAATREGVVHALGVSAARLRGELGEPPSSLARFNQPLDVATSSSPEALQQMLQGYQHHMALDLRGAAASYRRAIELDSNFALAYGALAAALERLDPAGARKAGLRAYDLRTRLTEPHRLRTEWTFYWTATGELEQALAVATQWSRTYPRDFTARLNLAVTMWQLGQPERATGEAREAVRLMPTLQTYSALITYAAASDRLQEARAALNQAVAHGFDGAELHRHRAYLAFLEQDTAAMEAEWRWAKDRPEVARLLPEQSSIAAYYGQFQRARALARRALQPDLRAAVRPEWLARAALSEAEIGNTNVARQAAASMIGDGSSDDTKLILALALARAGAAAPARAYADSFAQRFPLNTVIQRYFLPTIRAAIELQAHDPASAVGLLRQAEPYDMAMPSAFNDLYPAYVRGLAYLQLRDGARASGEFRKMLEHPGIMGRTVTGVLARLQLARAQVILGDTAGARNSYQAFLTLWKDADRDIPAYRQAKAELTHLPAR